MQLTSSMKQERWQSTWGHSPWRGPALSSTSWVTSSTNLSVPPCPCVSSGNNNGTYNRVVGEDHLVHVEHVEQCWAPQKVLDREWGWWWWWGWWEVLLGGARKRHVRFIQQVGAGAAELVLLGRGRGFPLDRGFSTVGTVKVERRLFWELFSQTGTAPHSWNMSLESK